MPSDRSGVLVRLPRAVKARLADEATRRGVSLNDVAVGALAARFGIPFRPSGRRGSAPRADGDVLLRMPVTLRDKLHARAAQKRRNLNDVIAETLSDELGLAR